MALKPSGRAAKKVDRTDSRFSVSRAGPIILGPARFFMQPLAIGHCYAPEVTGKQDCTPLHIIRLSIERRFLDGYFKQAGGVISHTEHERA